MSEEELIQLLASLGGDGGNLPGKTPANQLNYYQDLVSTLGFDPVQQVGLGQDQQPYVEPYVPKISKQRFTYESDPTYKKIFDLIDAGASPATAVKEAGLKDDQAKEAQSIAVNYASEVVDEKNAKAAYDQKTQKQLASYTAPDGSKYKNAPLGGNDIYASESEYNLLGAPTVDQLMQQLSAARQSSGKNDLTPRPQFRDKGEQKRSGYAVYTKPDGSVNYGNGPERSWEEPSLTPTGRTLIGDNTDPTAASAYRAAVQSRINKAKNTQVRSDAANNAMRRILALRTVIGS